MEFGGFLCPTSAERSRDVGDGDRLSSFPIGLGYSPFEVLKDREDTVVMSPGVPVLVKCFTHPLKMCCEVAAGFEQRRQVAPSLRPHLLRLEGLGAAEV